MAIIATDEEILLCGGTLIAAEWVVTVRSCLFQNEAGTELRPPNKLRVILGEHKLNDDQ